MNFDFIATLRKRKELTIKELAYLAKISSTRLGRIERNVADPKMSELESIMKVLNYKMVAKNAVNYYSREEFECVNESQNSLAK